MKTRFDVLYALFELKEAHLSQIANKAVSSPSSARQKLTGLISSGLVVQEKKAYAPNRKNPKTWNAFNIMKFCRDRGISHNLFLSAELATIVNTGLSKEEVKLSDFKGLNYKTTRKYLTYLNRINLAFIISKKPLTIKFVNDPVFDEILSFFGIARLAGIKNEKTAAGKPDYGELASLLKKLKTIKKDIDHTDLDKEAVIEFTSASTQLEGNTFTLEESKELIFHDLLPEHKRLREANEVKNYFNAVNYMISHLKEPISIDMIVDLHRIVTCNLGVKEGIRNSRVSIKGNPFYKVSDFSEILPRLNELCTGLNNFVSEGHIIGEIIEFATFVHNEFQYIHPFEDGNSRMTRLIWNYVLMKNGLPLINIYPNAKEEYLSLTKLARKRDDRGLNAFLTRIIKDNLFKMLRI